MEDKVTTDVPRRIQSPATTVTQESQSAFRSPEDVRDTLADHLRLMLEKPTVPWGTTLVWSEGGIAHIPSYEGHMIGVADKNGEIGQMVTSFLQSNGFTGGATERDCSWTRHYTRMSPDAHVGETGAFEHIKPEDRQIITYIGELSGKYEVYQKTATPGVWFIRATYSEETISDEGGYRSGTYSADKAAKYGLKKPEPSKPKVVWQIYRTPQVPKTGPAEHGYIADQRRKNVPEKLSIPEVPLPSPGNEWSKKAEALAAGTFQGGR